MLMRYTLPSRKLLVAAALVTVAASWLAARGRAHLRRLNAKPRCKPEHLQTWEGEGGAIPTPEGRTVAQVPAALSRETSDAGRP
jgi:DNA-binding protein H-NS